MRTVPKELCRLKIIAGFYHFYQLEYKQITNVRVLKVTHIMIIAFVLKHEKGIHIHTFIEDFTCYIH